MILLERLPRESGRDYALRTLKENIVRLELAPGGRISENEIATFMGISRTPVREALLDLSKSRIVEVYPQRGSTVALVDYATVEEARFMRETLECAVVERLCAAEPPKLTELRDNVRLQQFYLGEENMDKLWELDNAFHSCLFRLAGAPQVHALMDSLTIHFDRVRLMSLSAVKDNRTVADHQTIYEAIAARDAAAASDTMHRHLTRYQIDRAAICGMYPASYFKA